MGLKPTTLCSLGKCSTNWATMGNSAGKGFNQISMAAKFSCWCLIGKRFTDTSEQVILHMSLRVMYWSLRLSSTRSRATTLWSTLLTNTSRSPVRVKASATSWRILNGPPVYRERIRDVCVCVRGGGDKENDRNESCPVGGIRTHNTLLSRWVLYRTCNWLVQTSFL